MRGGWVLNRGYIGDGIKQTKSSVSGQYSREPTIVLSSLISINIEFIENLSFNTKTLNKRFGNLPHKIIFFHQIFTDGRYLEADTFPKIVKKNWPFFRSKLRGVY